MGLPEDLKSFKARDPFALPEDAAFVGLCVLLALAWIADRLGWLA